ncbi:DNA polymerase III [Macleaya cordata]|uniref:DNA polymerase III n=1 Tax=Macleaya cordata TaxID=56857 RepID=A0A200QYE6_MACCD|nr:DNA polymerase III [Macleaya cordata]
MSHAHVDPSELHWKKELTGLRKAARLRDPETSSSLRSPLNSRSVAAASSWNYGNGTRSNSIGANHAVGYSDLVSGLPVRNEKNRNKVFLYNWRHQSGKSSDYGAKLDGEKYGEVGSVDGSLKDSLEVPQKEDSKIDTYFDDPMMAFRVREANLERPLRRTVKKLKKGSAVSKHSIVRNSTNSNLLDLPSISLGALTSVQQSNDMEYCNTEDSRDITPKNGYTSRSTSPMPTRGENWSRSSKLLRSIWREDSSYSYTPASTCSYKYGNRNPSTVGSWDGNTASFDGDDLDHLDLPGRQGCGIPCYWSKRTPKHGGCGGCYSPSLSETFRRKGSSILCGSRTLYKKRRSSGSNERRLVTRSSQGMPLLRNCSDGRGGSSMDTGQSDDDLSTNFGELDMEALSRLDGRRWSSCRSQEGLELVPLAGAAEEGRSDHIRSLSQKYRPRFFDELIGQNIVVHSLINAISRGRIAPVYLFQGPRGTGKTSMARILTAALNCVATEETKPCGFCRECTDFISGKTMDLREVDATNKKGIDRVRYLLKSLSTAPMSFFSRYHVFIINDCHLLPSKTWSSFLKFLEEPLPRVVIIFITTDIDNVPHTVLSRCQKYLFNKIKDSDIINRLKKLSSDENLDVDSDALDLIALNAEGSLRDAETMLDQLSLLGKRITASLVNELVGVVSDEKLLDLLELAMSSDTAETVKRTRELMDSGVDPMALTSQLAGLIMDIIAGTYQLVNSKCSSSFFAGRSLTEAELERLKQALKLLSEAERQLRVSNERSTWFTAALLQLGSVPSPHHTHSSSSRKQSSKTTEDEPSGSSREVYARKKKSDALQRRWNSTSSALMPRPHDGDSSSQSESLLMVDASNFAARSTSNRLVEGGESAAIHGDTVAGNRVCRYISSEKLDDIWEMCIDRCHSKTLKQLLHAHAKLVSISEVEGVLIAFIGFKDGDIKSRAERFVRSITNSVEIVMRHNVEVRMGLMLRGDASVGITNMVEFPDWEMGTTEMIERELKGDSNNSVSGHSDLELHQEPLKVPTERFYSEGKQTGIPKQSDYSSQGVDGCYQVTPELPVSLTERNSGMNETEERNEEIPLQRIQTIIDEQRLESAWLQAAEKGTPGSLSRLKPERNQVLPQDGIYRPDQMASIISMELSSQKWEDELNHELKSLKINDGRGHHDQSGKRVENYPMSPSLLHDRSSAGNFNNENLGYESGQAPGCNGLICWKKTKPYNKGKVKQGTPIRSRKSRNFLLFGECMKTKKTDRRFKK